MREVCCDTCVAASGQPGSERFVVKPAYREVAPCPCDLTFQACDVSCCCDGVCLSLCLSLCLSACQPACLSLVLVYKCRPHPHCCLPQGPGQNLTKLYHVVKMTISLRRTLSSMRRKGQRTSTQWTRAVHALPATTPDHSRRQDKRQKSSRTMSAFLHTLSLSLSLDNIQLTLPSMCSVWMSHPLW